MEKLELSYSVKWCCNVGKHCQFLKKLNIVTIWPSNSTPKHITKKKWMPTRKLVHKCSRNSMTRISQTVETTQIPINWWINKVWCIILWSVIKRNKYWCMQRDPGRQAAKRKKSFTKDHILHDSICKSPERAILETK